MGGFCATKSCVASVPIRQSSSAQHSSRIDLSSSLEDRWKGKKNGKFESLMSFRCSRQLTCH